MGLKISVKCIRGLGDRIAPSISDSMLVTENMAVRRGKRFLDDPSMGGYYITVKRDFQTVHKSNLVYPGSWITLSDSHLGLNGVKVKVKEYSINITPNSVFSNISTEQYMER